MFAVVVEGGVVCVYSVVLAVVVFCVENATFVTFHTRAMHLLQGVGASAKMRVL